MPIEQSNFPPDYRSVAEVLEQEISEFVAVIHIVGMRYGSEPRTRSVDDPRRSYTQMEYYIAKRLKIATYVFICDEEFPFDDNVEKETEDRADANI